MKEKLAKIREEILKQIDASENLDKLNEVRVSALGKKGALTELLKSMKEVAPQDRPKVGQWSMKCALKLKQRWKRKKQSWKTVQWKLV